MVRLMVEKLPLLYKPGAELLEEEYMDPEGKSIDRIPPFPLLTMMMARSLVPDPPPTPGRQPSTPQVGVSVLVVAVVVRMRPRFRDTPGYRSWILPSMPGMDRRAN